MDAIDDAPSGELELAVTAGLGLRREHKQVERMDLKLEE